MVSSSIRPRARARSPLKMETQRKLVTAVGTEYIKTYPETVSGSFLKMRLLKRNIIRGKKMRVLIKKRKRIWGEEIALPSSRALSCSAPARVMVPKIQGMKGLRP
jgi:hypothetical protein